MSDGRRSNVPLYAALGCSVLLHLVVMVPLMVEIMRQPMQRAMLTASFEPQTVQPPPDEQVLGIERDTSTSTMTWVGYEEYQKHIAELAAIEQAAFDLASQPPTLQQTEPAPDADADADDNAHAHEMPEQMPAPQPQLAMDIATTLSERIAELMVAIRETSQGQADAESQAAADDVADTTATDDATPTDVSDAGDAGDAGDADTPQPPQPPTEPEPVTDEPTPAEPSDRQSPATSVDATFDDIRLGKPLAARGLELKPARPEFTTLDRVTLWPRHNPLVNISFASDGRPLFARIIESSGHPRIDDLMRSSLFRWRATGEDLATLSGDETIDVQIRIILRPELVPRD